MKTIILTGGGSAGHVTPNLALIPQLEKHFDNICYMGTNGIEKSLVESTHLPFYEIQAFKLERKLTFKNLLLPFKLFKTVKQAKKLLKEISPNIVFSKGGYVSLPVVIAAKKLKIPVVSHESDISMGLANKLILRYADCVCTSFSSTAEQNKKCVYTGSPVRPQIKQGKSYIARKITGIDNQRKTIMFFGGSLGAEAINNFVFNCLDDLLIDYNVIHITGKNCQTQIHKPNYYSCKFTNQIEHFFALADIVVCRAGSNSIFELLCIKKPMILIPLPKKASRGDQIDNAKYFEKHGYAKVIWQEDLNKNNFFKTINSMDLENISQKLSSSNLTNGNENIVKQILKYTNKK